MRSVEKQLVFIGHDQNVTLNRLRVCVNSYMHKLAEKNIIINRDEFDVLVSNKSHFIGNAKYLPLRFLRVLVARSLVTKSNYTF